MADAQGIFFDERFLDRHAGAIISDAEVAIVELVANAWDAWATRVDIVWAERGQDRVFAITDNGKGLTETQFLRRWGTIDYNKLSEEGPVSEPPEELSNQAPRKPYGRNGRGRHAAFRFGDPYRIRTWRDGREIVYSVQRGKTAPFDLALISASDVAAGHGTEISAPDGVGVGMTADAVREALGTRFLSDPQFIVTVNGETVTFGDVPAGKLQRFDVEVPDLGIAELTVIDTQKADKTTRQHGVAWWVNARLVGAPGWSDYELDGRTTEAKRFIFIVKANFLADENAPLPDWTGFDSRNGAWQKTRAAVYERIRKFMAGVTAQRRAEAKTEVRDRLSGEVARMPPVSRDRWNSFVDTVIDTCPSINTDEVEQVAKVLAQLELANSKYGLIGQLHDMKPNDLDELHAILKDWSVRTAKMALDEVQTRLRLVEELDLKLRDQSLSEVGDLQPLLERSLWVFGPEFESLEFTSNRGMTTVIQKIFGSTETGSLLRPDFVMLPDGSAGFYSRDAHDEGHEVNGVARLVIAEIKKAGVTISSGEKNQPWRYVSELREKGHLTESARITCYVLGSHLDPNEASEDTKWDGRVRIIPMTYDTFTRRAEKRLLGLRQKLKDAPFLKDLGLDADAFIAPPPGQATLDLGQ
ncbi:ATP-binding protein [Brevundimonas naejangsanensis]|uniref:ATP-binding protein n=1 Tax=Brevundimonas naejangsanensis TaxID=588932 RepID=UPI0032088245